MPPPVPPSVNDGRMIAGRPTWSSALVASSRLWTTSVLGLSSPMRVMASRDSSGSSALSIASALAPISSALNVASRAARGRPIAALRAGGPRRGGRGCALAVRAAVERGAVGDLHALVQRFGGDAEAVILRSDLDLARGDVLYRLVAAAIAAIHLFRLAAEGQRRQLVREADGEQRHAL